jgi:hypothetical protein
MHELSWNQPLNHRVEALRKLRPDPAPPELVAGAIADKLDVRVSIEICSVHIGFRSRPGIF